LIMFNNVHVYLAGIINGSQNEDVVYDQDYRKKISRALKNKYKGIDIYDPFHDKESIFKMSEKEKKAFFINETLRCLYDIDLIISYLPEASMGTAIEMFEAWIGHSTILTISPMKSNWTVKFLSDRVYDNIDDFIYSVKNNELDTFMNETKLKRRH